MDSANFITLAGRLVRDAIARGTLNPDTGGAFIATAQNLVSHGATFATTPMVIADTTVPPAIEQALHREHETRRDVDDDGVRQARANAFAKRMEGTE